MLLRWPRDFLIARLQSDTLVEPNLNIKFQLPTKSSFLRYFVQTVNPQTDHCLKTTFLGFKTDISSKEHLARLQYFP